MITRNQQTSRVPHRRRPSVCNDPLHVTLHLIDRLPNLRNPREHRLIVGAIRKCQERFGCRVFGYCVLFNHLHLLVEAVSESKLAQAMKGLEVRIARGLNKLWERKGSIFRDRFHCRVLKTLTDIHRAVRYVIQNGRKHGGRCPRTSPIPAPRAPGTSTGRDARASPSAPTTARWPSRRRCTSRWPVRASRSAWTRCR
jgi:REP element-mobilizing transposase RayT